MQPTRNTQTTAEGIDKFKFKCNIAPKVDSFKRSYFFRTVNQWNLLPLKIRCLENIDKFNESLKQQMWLILGLEPD